MQATSNGPALPRMFFAGLKLTMYKDKERLYE